jgi:aryl sulfotransferase
MKKPVKSKIYQHSISDSERWSAINFRDDDIVIATPSKAGTTRTQTIVAHLLFPRNDFPEPIQIMSEWVDNDRRPIEEVVASLAEQPYRRFLKTHLPLDGTPYSEKAKYIMVCRDGRDIVMSLWNHCSNYSDLALARLQANAKAMGREFPVSSKDVNVFWQEWCTKGWFDWQHDGWPHWSDLHVMQSWWEYRHLPNIHLVHYANMLADTPSAIRDLAAYLAIEVDEERVAEIAEIVSFDNMKANNEKYVPSAGRGWVGGGDTFFNKGTNGRWQDEITAENLALYDKAADRVLSPDCRHWTENAGPLP